MKPYYESSLATIYHGDCREVMAGLEQESIDSLITDPPYGLSFMGREWDHGVPGQEFWEAASRACKPGASLLAFGGTRTHHRLICAIEDAGWEIRDCLMWLYGSGFPKSYSVSKGIDKALGHEVDGEEPATDESKPWKGWGTGLKPSWEPIVSCMKPLQGTYAQNALQHGVAGLNIDGSRIGTDSVGGWQGGGTKLYDGGLSKEGGEARPVSGRWPANLLLDEASATMLDEQGQHGVSRPESLACGSRRIYGGGWNPDLVRDYNHNDSGGPSRFFYTSKASTTERGAGNIHPTVKPLGLMKWLVNLTATPTGGLVLDPFMGSGSTLVGARDVGRPAIGIETEEKYCEIAANRLAQEVMDFGAGSIPGVDNRNNP